MACHRLLDKARRKRAREARYRRRAKGAADAK
jgi:hypothetical protein